MTDDIFKNKCVYASKLVENPQAHLEWEEVMHLVEVVTSIFKHTELNKDKSYPEFELFLADFTSFIKCKKQRGKFKDVYYSNRYNKNKMNQGLTSLLSIG